MKSNRFNRRRSVLFLIILILVCGEPRLAWPADVTVSTDVGSNSNDGTVVGDVGGRTSTDVSNSCPATPPSVEVQASYWPMLSPSSYIGSICKETDNGWYTLQCNYRCNCLTAWSHTSCPPANCIMSNPASIYYSVDYPSGQFQEFGPYKGGLVTTAWYDCMSAGLAGACINPLNAPYPTAGDCRAFCIANAPILTTCTPLSPL